MNEIIALLEQLLAENALRKLTFSAPRDKADSRAPRITGAPFLQKGTVVFQLTHQFEKKVLHQNVALSALPATAVQIMEHYKNLNLLGTAFDYTILQGKNGSVSITKKAAQSKAPAPAPHNREKHYLLQEGTVYDFLVALDISTADGKIKAAKYHKFVQINKYLEIVADGVKKLGGRKKLTIVDFGCGKAYLTFALYYYLNIQLGLDLLLLGVDLKEEVIDFCQALAQKLGYDQMRFVKGDIRDFEYQEDVDIVLSLHACDTATDEAIIKAVSWNCRLFIAVPCCQHELFTKLQAPVLQPLQKYGILNDKLTEIVTDALRGLVLEIKGYSVDIMEFLPLEHTMKNVLIRARKTGRPDSRALERYRAFTAFFQIAPYLQTLIEKELHNGPDPVCREDGPKQPTP